MVTADIVRQVVTQKWVGEPPRGVLIVENCSEGMKNVHIFIKSEAFGVKRRCVLPLLALSMH